MWPADEAKGESVAGETMTEADAVAVAGEAKNEAAAVDGGIKVETATETANKPGSSSLAETPGQRRRRIPEAALPRLIDLVPQIPGAIMAASKVDPEDF